MGFFNPVIFTQIFLTESRYADDHFWHPVSHACFETRITPRFCFQITPRFCFQITNFEFQVREIPDPDNLLGTSGKAH